MAKTKTKETSPKRLLIHERKELEENYIDLIRVINSEDFYKLSPNNRQLLKNKKIAMELYLNVLNTQVYEDIDSVTIPDYGFLQLMCNVFGGNILGSNPFPNNLKELSEEGK